MLYLHNSIPLGYKKRWNHVIHCYVNELEISWWIKSNSQSKRNKQNYLSHMCNIKIHIKWNNIWSVVKDTESTYRMELVKVMRNGAGWDLESLMVGLLYSGVGYDVETLYVCLKYFCWQYGKSWHLNKVGEKDTGEISCSC